MLLPYPAARVFCCRSIKKHRRRDELEEGGFPWRWGIIGLRTIRPGLGIEAADAFVPPRRSRRWAETRKRGRLLEKSRVGILSKQLLSLKAGYHQCLEQMLDVVLLHDLLLDACCGGSELRVGAAEELVQVSQALLRAEDRKPVNEDRLQFRLNVP